MGSKPLALPVRPLPAAAPPMVILGAPERVGSVTPVSRPRATGS